MNMTELTALLPIIIIALIPIATMLTIAFVRNHWVINVITSGGFLLALLVLGFQMHSAGQSITALLYIDAYNAFFMATVLVAGLSVSVLSFAYFDQVEALIEEYYVLLSLAVLGAVVLISSSHFATFFIGIELMGLSLFAMVGYLVTGATRLVHNLEASVKYMILSGVSSSFLLFGLALIYADTGVLETAVLSTQISQGQDGTALSHIGFVMVLVGIGFKLSVVPFHIWTPDVYQGAPLPVTTFLASVSKVAVCAFSIRFMWDSGVAEQGLLAPTLAAIAVASILFGNLLALKQDNVQRLLAYSSIAHFGYIMVSFVAVSLLVGVDWVTAKLAIESVALYLVAYLLMTICAFGVLIVLSDPKHGEEVASASDLKGLLWRRPLWGLFFIVALLSLAGMPLTLGFIGKFLVLAAGVNFQLWWLLGVMVIGSAMGLYYYLRLIIMVIQPNEQASEDTAFSVSIGATMVVGTLTIATVVLGVFPEPLLSFVKFAVGQL